MSLVVQFFWNTVYTANARRVYVKSKLKKFLTNIGRLFVFEGDPNVYCYDFHDASKSQMSQRRPTAYDVTEVDNYVMAVSTTYHVVMSNCCPLTSC